MAEVAIEIRGTLFHLWRGRSGGPAQEPVLLRGRAHVIGLEIGGGPMPGGPELPVDPGYGYPERPVDPGYGLPIEHPEHPIVIPDPPPSTTPGADKPPPAGQPGWGYVAQWDDGTPGGWGYFPASHDKPNPPSGSVDPNKPA